MGSIGIGLWPNGRAMRILAMREATETILKARLSLRPSNPRAVMTTLFAALARWEHRPDRAALGADESSTRSCPTTLCRDTFAIYGERAALYESPSREEEEVRP